jgi:hypothetical protein
MDRRRRHLHAVDGGGEEEKPRGGRPAKTLEQHIADGSFEKRKHADLLEEDALVDDAELRKVPQRYRRL